MVVQRFLSSGFSKEEVGKRWTFRLQIWKKFCKNNPTENVKICVP